MEHARKTSSPQSPAPMHGEMVTRANESLTPRLSAKSTTESASNPLSAYSITDSRQKMTPPPETLETVKPMEMALKILSSPPVIPTLSGELERYRNNVSVIQQTFESALKSKSLDEFSKDWGKCETIANVLLAVLNEKQGKADSSAARKALKQWAQSYILLAKANQCYLGSYRESPVKTQDEFITWCLAVARAASIGSPTIVRDSSLEYLCYIRALNAGCAEAQLFIVRDHLLGELYKRPPSCERFLPKEAEAQLKSIAARKEPLLRPEGLDETHYEIIYELVNLIRSDSKDRENKRDALANRWIACKEYEIQQLTLMLYLQDAYGILDIQKAQKHLATISYERCQDIMEFSSLNLVQQYWFAEIGIADASNSTGIMSMEALATDMHPAALYSLIEHSQLDNADITTTDSLLLLERSHLFEGKKQVKTNSLDYCIKLLENVLFKNGIDSQWYFRPVIILTYNSPLAYKLFTFWRWFCSKRQSDFPYTHVGARETEIAIIIQGTTEQANEVLSSAYTTFENKNNHEKTSCPLSDFSFPIDSVFELDAYLQKLENNFPFVDDPQILVFRHFSDFLTQGKADDKLLDSAIAKHPMTTCYRLLSLNHCTRIWGYNKLIEKLLEHTKVNIDFLNLFRDDAGFGNFIKRMTHSYTLKYPAAYCQLMNSISKWIGDKKTLIVIYKQIAIRQLIQGHESDADSMHKKARALMEKDLKISHNKLENRYRILRSSMPVYYLDLYETGFHDLHALNVIFNFDTMIMTGKHLLKNNNDPAAHLAWCYRMSTYFLTRYIVYSCNLKDPSQIIAACELQKKISSRIGRLNQQLMIATAKRVENFLEHLPDDVSQTRFRKQLYETISEIRSIAKAAIPHQFASCQENSGKSQGDNHNLTAEQVNDLSECTLITDDIYPKPNSPDDFYKDITNFITEHILAPKIRQTRSLNSAMALFNQLNKSDDFNSARFTALLIDTISRMEAEFVPGVMERLCFCLERFKKDCERSVKCFFQHILRYNILSFLKGHTVLLPKKNIKDLNDEFEALKTRVRIAYPDISVYANLSKEVFKEEQSWTIFNGQKMAQSINSMQTLLNETELHTTSNVMLMMRYIRSFYNRENLQKRFKPDWINKNKEIAKLMNNILTGNLDAYNITLRINKSKHRYNNGVLLWLALESGKFDEAMLEKIVEDRLTKTSPGYYFLKVLLASKPETIMERITKFLQIISPEADIFSHYTMKDSHAIVIVHKILYINKIGSFLPELITTQAPTFPYLEAMLYWRHPGKLSSEATMDKICTALVTSSREAIPEASCRLLDFILEQESRGKGVSDITACQCCRFIHAQSLIATDEQTLYQGITLYLGKGCVSDKEEGLKLINLALASDSPIPALRMARLQEQQLFPTNVLEQDCLKLFAQKADTDQELYRDYKQVIFIELLLSLGESGLDWLIRQLKSAPDDDISSSRIAELFQKKLDIWRENGIESAQQPSLPEEQNVASTVTSKQPSQSAVKPESHPVRGNRTKKGNLQKGRQDRKSKSVPRPVVRHEKPVTSQQLLEQLVVKNKDKAASEISGEEITEVLKLLEQLKQKTTTAVRDLSKNRLANLVRMLPWSATILGEVIAAHLGNMTDAHTRANYARHQLERYECLISERLTVTGGDTETQAQDAMAKTKATTGKLLVQGPVPPGVRELIKNTTQAHQETLLSGNLSKDELSAAVTLYPDLYLHYLQETKKPEINCVKSIWEGLGTKSQTALLTKAGAILVTDQCGKEQDSAIKILNDEKLSNDARLSLFDSLQKESMETLLMPSEGIPDNLVRAYLERMKKTPPKQKTTRHQIRSINQWQTSPENRLTDNLIHLLKELPSEATEQEKMKLREFREALKKDMDSKIESIGVIGTSLTTGLAKRFKASAILMELKEIAKAEAEAEQETLQPG